MEKLSTTALPQNPGDSVLCTNTLEVTCTLAERTDVSRIVIAGRRVAFEIQGHSSYPPLRRHAWPARTALTPRPLVLL